MQQIENVQSLAPPRLGNSPVLSTTVLERGPKRLVKHIVNQQVAYLAIDETCIHNKGVSCRCKISKTYSHSPPETEQLSSFTLHRLRTWAETGVETHCGPSHKAPRNPWNVHSRVVPCVREIVKTCNTIYTDAVLFTAYPTPYWYTRQRGIVQSRACRGPLPQQLPGAGSGET